MISTQLNYFQTAGIKFCSRLMTTVFAHESVANLRINRPPPPKKGIFDVQTAWYPPHEASVLLPYWRNSYLTFSCRRKSTDRRRPGLNLLSHGDMACWWVLLWMKTKAALRTLYCVLGLCVCSHRSDSGCGRSFFKPRVKPQVHLPLSNGMWRHWPGVVPKMLSVRQRTLLYR